MPLFVDNIGQIASPGVYIVDVKTPTLLEGIPLGKIGFVGQFNWGPVNEVYEPTSTQDFIDHYEPAGATRNTTGYYALMRRRGLSLAVVRAQSTSGSPAAATFTKAASAGTGNLTATAKYKGTLGNSINVTTASPASDGVATHLKITVSLTNSTTGEATVEVYDNLDMGTSATVTVDVTNSILLSALTFPGTATDFADSTTAFSGGANGSAVAASDYELGLDALDMIDDVRCIVTDSGITASIGTLNSDLATHAAAKTDRLAILNGPSTEAWTAVKSTKAGTAAFLSKYVLYVGNWVNVKDDAGTERLTPAATFIASVLVNNEPQQSHAWWDESVTKYYSGISSLYTTYFSPGDATVQSEAMNAGIQLVFRLPDGRYAALHDRNTSTSAADRYAVTIRIRIYLGLTLKTGLASFTNGPNITAQQRDIVQAVTALLDAEVGKGRITEYSLNTGLNTTTTQAQGYYLLGIEATTPAPMERIALLLKAGPTVTITAN